MVNLTYLILLAQSNLTVSSVPEADVAIRSVCAPSQGIGRKRMQHIQRTT